MFSLSRHSPLRLPFMVEGRDTVTRACFGVPFLGIKRILLLLLYHWSVMMSLIRL